MIDEPERIWAALEEVGEAETSFEATYFGKCSHSYAGMSYATEYIRKDVSDALVAAERERCALLCENTEMGVPMKSSAADCANYASMKRDKNAAGTHPGMGYAAAIRKGSGK